MRGISPINEAKMDELKELLINGSFVEFQPHFK